MVKRRDLAGCVEILGQRSQSDVGLLMQEADVLVFPSIRELGAGVVIEAMATGCVPVVVDYGAPASLVTDATGCRVPLGTKSELITAFQNQLEKLAANPQVLRRMSEASYERAITHFAWSAKARKTIEVYDWVLGRRQNPPTFEH